MNGSVKNGARRSRMVLLVSFAVLVLTAALALRFWLPESSAADYSRTVSFDEGRSGWYAEGEDTECAMAFVEVMSPWELWEISVDNYTYQNSDHMDFVPCDVSEVTVVLRNWDKLYLSDASQLEAEGITWKDTYVSQGSHDSGYVELTLENVPVEFLEDLEVGKTASISLPPFESSLLQLVSFTGLPGDCQFYFGEDRGFCGDNLDFGAVRPGETATAVMWSGNYLIQSAAFASDGTVGTISASGKEVTISITAGDTNEISLELTAASTLHIENMMGTPSSGELVNFIQGDGASWSGVYDAANTQTITVMINAPYPYMLAACEITNVDAGATSDDMSVEVPTPALTFSSNSFTVSEIDPRIQALTVSQTWGTEVGVVSVSGEGYTLETAESAVSGSGEGAIVARLTVEAGYSGSTPAVTPPGGYELEMGAGEADESGNVIYMIRIFPAGGTFGDEDLSVTVSGIIPNSMIGVVPINGAGYTLETAEPVPAGSAESALVARLIVAPDYSGSTPAVALPAGYGLEMGEGETADDGSVIYMLYIYPSETPFGTENVAVTISGIVSNNPGGGGSGGGGSDSGGDSSDSSESEPEPEEKQIRVSNDLNEENISSDTILWPLDTVEEDGVSTTTVRAEELEALLELARKHEKDAEGLEGDGIREAIILIKDLEEDSDNHTYILILTAEQYQALADEEWDRLTVMTPAGSFSLNDAAILEEAEQAEDTVRIELHRQEYKGRTAVDVVLRINGQEVTGFELPYGVQVFIPYEPAEGEDPNALTVEYIREDGTTEIVTESTYDAERRGLIVVVSHLSKYGVAYRPAAFPDVGADHWANPYVTFLTARGLVNGEGGRYRPDDAITRGEFLQLVTKALSASKLPRRPIQLYSDVPVGSPLAAASNWVYYNNLAPFATGGKLLPDQALTREEVASLLGNAASGIGLRVRSRGMDSGFTDLDGMSAQTRASVKRLSAAGIFWMPDNYKFNPKATLNRGEAARVLANLLSNI